MEFKELQREMAEWLCWRPDQSRAKLNDNSQRRAFMIGPDLGSAFYNQLFVRGLSYIEQDSSEGVEWFRARLKISERDAFILFAGPWESRDKAARRLDRLTKLLSGHYVNSMGQLNEIAQQTGCYINQERP